jgi:hypothetical protein
MTTLRLLVAALALLAPLSARADCRPPDDLDPGLVGSWHWETSSYVSTGDFATLIKTTRDVTIDANGDFSYRQVSSIDGDVARQPEVVEVSGHVVQEGNVLIATSDRGQRQRFRFRLVGDNGLEINGVLFEKQ